MSAFRDLMSMVDPTAAKSISSARPATPGVNPKPAARPASGANGATQTPQLKRKASGAVESGQVKIQRKDTTGPPAQANGVPRPIASPGAARSIPPAAISTVPYRGTAAPAGSKVSSPAVKKPIAQANAPAPALKAPVSAPKPAAATSSAVPKKGYLALLQKAKEKDATKPAAPPVQNGPTKMMTKKERLALRAEASAAKGKKPVAAIASKQLDPKSDPPKAKKPAEMGYQGTARPKQPAQVGYKGTARPSSAPASASRGGTPTAKAKPKPEKGRYDGYADWSDLDDVEDEDDYASDGSSDMEGGVWDVEQEEKLALQAAKKEDAAALAEENRLKREKEERKRKLMAMSQAAASKRKY